MNHKNVAAVERAIHAAASSNRGVVYNDYTPEAIAAIETVFDNLITECDEVVMYEGFGDPMDAVKTWLAECKAEVTQ